MQISPLSIFLVAAIFASVGFTLLNYSADGDLKNRKKERSRFADSSLSSRNDAWERLTLLTNAGVMEVTWNTSLFVALISSLVCVSLVDFAKTSNHKSTTAIIGILSLLTVFGLQDTVIRWKNAHRKHPSTAEQISIIDRLRWTTENKDK